MTYNNVRALTIGKTEDPSRKGGFNTNDPRRWLPPESAIANIAELFQLQIEYMETAGTHNAVLPSFITHADVNFYLYTGQYASVYVTEI